MNSKLSYSLIIILSLLFVVPLLVLSYYNQPSADDFSYACKVKELGFWGAQISWYCDWSGRYFATLLLSLNPISFGFLGGYKFLSIFIILAFLCAAYYLVKELFGNKMTNAEHMCLALLLFFIYIFELPNLVEGIYWMAGVLSYQISHILLMVLLVMLLRLNKSTSKKYILIGSAIVIMISGSNETVMLLQMMVLCGVLLGKWIVVKKFDRVVGLLLLIGILCAVIVFLAPGNAIRNSHFTGTNNQFLFSILASLKELNHYFFKWLPMVLMASVLIIPVFYSMTNTVINNKERYSLLYLNPMIVLVGILFLLIAGFFPAFWSMGSAPPNRTMDTIYFIMMMSWFYFMWVLVFYIERKYNFKLSSSNLLNYSIVLLMVVWLIRDNNNSYKMVANDLISGKAKAYDTFIAKRYEITRSSSGPVLLRKIQDAPESLFFSDLSKNESDWKNDSYGKYFDKDVIIVTDASK